MFTAAVARVLKMTLAERGERVVRVLLELYGDWEEVFLVQTQMKRLVMAM